LEGGIHKVSVTGINIEGNVCVKRAEFVNLPTSSLREIFRRIINLSAANPQPN